MNLQAIFENILNRNLAWPDDPDSDISDECKDLIDRLLQSNPEERLGHRGAGEVNDSHTIALIKSQCPTYIKHKQQLELVLLHCTQRA